MKLYKKSGELGFFIQDAVRGTRIMALQKLLDDSQLWSDEEMSQYRLNKLHDLIDHAFRYVPYYRDLFTKIGLKPSDIKTLDDLCKIPVLTKETARKNQSALISEAFAGEKIKRGRTGGTTGVPLTVMKDTEDRSFAWASYYRWYNWIGIRKNERVLTFWGMGPVLRPSLKYLITENVTNLIQNNRTLNSFNMSEKSMDSFYRQMMKYDPVLIKGYVSALIGMATYMKKNNLPANKSLRALSGTSETLLPIYRQLLESVFGVEVYDQYGCGEVSAISYECTAHKGLHINEEHVIVETLNDLDEPVTGCEGRVVVTSLDNKIMPFIRYDNGDIATLLPGKCSCGITSHLMSHVEGRTTDLITLIDGSKVHGVFFTKLLAESGITTDIIDRFQIYQHLSGETDIRLETKKRIPENLIDKLDKNMHRFLNKVAIMVVDHIENEENGKFKYIKSEVV